MERTSWTGFIIMLCCALYLILYLLDEHHPFDLIRSSQRPKQSYDICIVGAGLSGAVIAERYANKLKQTVYVMEKRNHIGGNCYDYTDEETGIRINKYGAHLFHTKYSRVWDYIQQFSDWTPYEHEVLAFVDGKHVPVPVNIETVNTLFGLAIQNADEMDKWLGNEQVHFDEPPNNSEEMSLSRVGKRLYEKMFKPYTIKQWAKTPAQLGPEVMARIPVRNNHDARYFGDKWQALPSKGYTAIFDNMFDNPRITVETNVDYFQVRDTLNCGRTYYTGPVDTYFADLGWPKLEYRSLDFVREVYETKDYYQPNSVVNHPSETVPYTRIVEYKHFLNQKSNKTIIFKEFSKDNGEPYYPVPNPVNKVLFEKYKAMSEKEPNVTFVGRLANYKYFNMDETIKNALELFDKDNSHVPTIAYNTSVKDNSHVPTIDGTTSVKHDTNTTKALQIANTTNGQVVKASMVQQIYNKFKQHIDNKIKTIPKYGTPCSPYPVYNGEFGYELQGIVPWYYDDFVNKKCDLNVTGVQGMRYVYWFSSDFVLVNKKRAYQGLPAAGPLHSGSPHVQQLPTTGWTMPPYREFFKDGLSVYELFQTKKPLLIVFNKYAFEWGSRPTNFLSIDTLERLFSKLDRRFQIIYIRMESKRLDDKGAIPGKQLPLSFGDKTMIRKTFPNIIIFDDIYDDNKMDYNLMVFGLASQCGTFISVQGGNSVVASLWGGRNFIYAKKGEELKVNAYHNWYNRFGGARVWSSPNNEEFIKLILTEV